MFRTPSADQMLDAVIAALQRDIAPELQTPQGHMTLALMQTILQIVRSRLPVEQEWMASECSTIAATLEQVAAGLETVEGPAAARIRDRRTAIDGADIAPPVTPHAQTAERYARMTDAVTATLEDLDTLLRDGEIRAQEGLDAVRQYLAARSQSEMACFVATAGLAGRG